MLCNVKFQQVEIYKTYDTLRQEEMDYQLELYRENQLIEEIQRKKEELKSKEDIIFFFDKKDQLELLLPREHG